MVVVWPAAYVWPNHDVVLIIMGEINPNPNPVPIPIALSLQAYLTNDDKL